MKDRLKNVRKARRSCMLVTAVALFDTEYSNLLFNLCDNDNASLEDLEKIAVDILEHSDWEKKAAEYGASYDELVRSVMTNLLNECCYTIIEAEEDKK